VAEWTKAQALDPKVVGSNPGHHRNPDKPEKFVMVQGGGGITKFSRKTENGRTLATKALRIMLAMMVWWPSWHYQKQSGS